jgi:hypothetical protein
MGLCLASFYARTKTSGFLFANQTPEGTGAIYFGHLAHLTKADLVQRLAPDVDAAEREYVEDSTLSARGAIWAMRHHRTAKASPRANESPSVGEQQ